MKRTLKLTWALLLSLSVAFVSSCKDDEPEPEVLAGFSFKVSATDYKTVEFTNGSKNYATLAWDFGDGSAISTDANPTHTFATLGEFNVKLTATSPSGVVDAIYQKVTISDPNAELTKLVGEGNAGKTWKLLRDVSGGVYPLEVGPIDHSAIWWAVGLGNDELPNRPCMFNDEWTFKRDGTMVYDAKGDYWAEGGVFKAGSDNTCGNTSDPMIGIDPTNENLSAWGGGTHHFRLDAAKKKVTAIGKGAFIGFLKASTDCEVMKLTPMVQDSVSYDVISLVDGTVDTLIVQVNYKFNPTDAAPGGYWRFVLVHYDNATDEPALPGFKPIPNFSMNKNGLTVAFESTTKYGTSYEWDFGDGATSTDKNPTHTYAADGFYTVSLKSTNQFGDASVSMLVTASTTNLTDAILQGGSWKVQVADLTVFVGPAMFSTSWWAVPVAGLNGSATGGDDWSCLPDDEFIFSSGGVFEYKTNGTARNDGYFGGDNGCITDAAIAESGNGAAFGSAVHSYIFNSGKKGVNAMPTITLSNGSGHAAFLGFYKGYYGGENTDKTKAPNGGNTTNIYEAQYVKIGAKEYLVVSTDISADHSRTKSWSAILER